MSPFAEGSGFGWEIRYSGIGLALQARAEPAVRMIDQLTPGFDYQGRVQKATADGYLSEPWAGQLQENWWWRDPDDATLIHTWTGLVAKPKPGFRLRVTELFNSPHLQLTFREQTLDNPKSWSPILLSARLRDTERCAYAGSVACISPLPAVARLQTATLADHKWVGDRTLAYYHPSYYEEKLTAPPTRRYAKLLRQQATNPSAGTAPSTLWDNVDALILAANPEDAEQVRLGTDAGDQMPVASTPQLSSGYAELLAPADIQLLYLGRGLHITMGETWEPQYNAVRNTWQQLFGDAGSRYLNNATYEGESCVHPTPGHPVLVVNIEPLVRFATRPGWSLMFEGSSKCLPWGLRGIIRSSEFHSGALAFQLFGTPQSQLIAQGDPLGRCWPIPDALQQATYQNITWQAPVA